MRRCESISLGRLLPELLKVQYPAVSEHLQEMQLVKHWPQVVGPYIARRTEQVEVKDHVLCVRLTSAPLRNELFNNRQVLVQRLNDSVGSMVVTDLRFQ